MRKSVNNKIMGYSKDYKKRTVAYKQEDHTFKELKEAFKIPAETYYKWKEKLERGYYDEKIIRERSRKIDKEKLKQAVKEKPDAYLSELAELFVWMYTASSVLRVRQNENNI